MIAGLVQLGGVVVLAGAGGVLAGGRGYTVQCAGLAIAALATLGSGTSAATAAGLVATALLAAAKPVAVRRALPAAEPGFVPWLAVAATLTAGIVAAAALPGRVEPALGLGAVLLGLVGALRRDRPMLGLLAAENGVALAGLGIDGMPAASVLIVLLLLGLRRAA